MPWEEDLLEGPVGEYLEVIDFDPATGCFYEPVNLNDPYLLAADGIAPSEGNPQVPPADGLRGRDDDHPRIRAGPGEARALVAELVRDDNDRVIQDIYVDRLRVYPHALREANAYYSPDKKALLFGYFPAPLTNPGENLPGGLVFTCLSHDVVAHETTHALLDGLHRYFTDPSNPDVHAFHEAFADIVALFQHFSQPESLRAPDLADAGRPVEPEPAGPARLPVRPGDWRPWRPARRHRPLGRSAAEMGRARPSIRTSTRPPRKHMTAAPSWSPRCSTRSSPSTGAHRRPAAHRHDGLGGPARGEPASRPCESPGRGGDQDGQPLPADRDPAPSITARRSTSPSANT